MPVEDAYASVLREKGGNERLFLFFPEAPYVTEAMTNNGFEALSVNSTLIITGLTQLTSEHQFYAA